MSAVVDQFLREAPALDRKDKILVLRTLADLLFPKRETNVEGIIRKTPGVVGGSARIRDMRIPVWMIVQLRDCGHDDSSIKQLYPQLTDEDLAAVTTYYRVNRAEVDAEIAENDAA